MLYEMQRLTHSASWALHAVTHVTRALHELSLTHAVRASQQHLPSHVPHASDDDDEHWELTAPHELVAVMVPLAPPAPLTAVVPAAPPRMPESSAALTMSVALSTVVIPPVLDASPAAKHMSDAHVTPTLHVPFG